MDLILYHQHRFRLLNLQLQLNRQQAQNNIILAHAFPNQRTRKRKRRTVWVRPWLQRRDLLGHYTRLMGELNIEDLGAYKNFLRMDPAMFQEILFRIEDRIRKNDTWFRKAIPPGLKLAITLRYLAPGDSFHSLMYAFRVSHNAISLLIRDVCETIIEIYAEEVIACPVTPDEWKTIADGFGIRWQLHHCLGALDGKHIAIKCPKNGGSLYYNYKGFYSVILLALVDAQYKFVWVDIGANGSSGDAQVFNNSDFKKAIENNTIGFPAQDPLPADDKNIPYFIVADDAFALKTWLMKPFSKRNLTDEERIYNYRLSRARRVVENAFGILANRFQCLLTTMRQQPNTIVSIVLACICLHNLMRLRYPRAQNVVLDQEDQNHNIVPGSWRDNQVLIDANDIVGGNRLTRAAKAQREYLKAYYNSEAGAVPWQGNMI